MTSQAPLLETETASRAATIENRVVEERAHQWPESVLLSIHIAGRHQVFFMFSYEGAWFGNLGSSDVTDPKFGQLGVSSIDDTSEPRLIVLVMKIVF